MKINKELRTEIANQARKELAKRYFTDYVSYTHHGLHAYCRCTTIPHFDDDGIDREDREKVSGQRAARGMDGKTYYVPEDMAYDEWKEQFVSIDKGVESNLNVTDHPKNNIATTEINISGNDEKTLKIPPNNGIINTGGGKMDYKQLSSEQRLNAFTDIKERNIAQYLEDIGRYVTANELEGLPGMGRQGDAFVDGVKTEFKTLNAEATPNTIKNSVNNSISGKGQARRIVIDARNTSLTKEEAEQGIFKALGISRGKIDYIEVIGKDYFFGYEPK